MEETQNFIERLESAILKKKEWFDSTQLPSALEQYRLMLVCVKTVNENLVKRSIITPDPYKWDKRISEVVVPPADAFTEQDFGQVLGERLSSYETMLDFVCNYYRFNVDSIPVTKVKLLVDLNKCFQWDNLTTANGNPNTQGLATAIQRVKMNAPNMTLSMINDSVDKCSKAYGFIAKTLAEFAGFQREYYKWSVRKEVIGSSDFDKAKAFSSKENECAEIKKLFQKIHSSTITENLSSTLFLNQHTSTVILSFRLKTTTIFSTNLFLNRSQKKLLLLSNLNLNRKQTQFSKTKIRALLNTTQEWQLFLQPMNLQKSITAVDLQ